MKQSELPRVYAFLFPPDRLSDQKWYRASASLDAISKKRIISGKFIYTIKEAAKIQRLIKAKE